MAGLTDTRIDPGSFRDPSGYVFHSHGRIFRALSQRGADAFQPVLGSGLLADWEARGQCVTTRVVDEKEWPEEVISAANFDIVQVLEHSRVEYISHPYEWPFALLKRAAILHLTLQLEALDADISFSDSSAYNIQFVGSRPTLIDILSLRPYVDGEYWDGYRQFCEQFLNPLLLTAKLGLPYAQWYRGSLHGISVEEIAAALPLHSKLSWNMMSHVSLHAYLTRNARQAPNSQKTSTSERKLSKSGLRAMISGMRSWIESLKPRGFDDTFWADYEKNNSYEPEHAQVKRSVVQKLIDTEAPQLVFDLGCNSGDYSELALDRGVSFVVGFDFDHGALSAAVSRATSKELNFLPLFLDISNPSPDQGWRQLERQGFSDRSKPDAILALALIHHMVIGRNIPLGQAVSWLVGIAPAGIIEFVPKSDPMVVNMLSSREDIFFDYELSSFRSALGAHAQIVAETEVTPNGRVLFHYRTEVK